jgi:signal transduction histidine kinase
VARPQPGLSDLNGLVEETRDAGTPVDLVDRISRPGELPDALGRTAYRIVQEGLTNARKHAPGRPARLLLDGHPGDRLLVELTNPVGPGPVGPANPVGLAPAGPASVGPANPVEPASADEPSLNGSGTGTGLIGLAERVRLAGGEIDHEVAPDGEFLLRALLPWPATQATSATPATLTVPGTPTTPACPTEPTEPA